MMSALDIRASEIARMSGDAATQLARAIHRIRNDYCEGFAEDLYCERCDTYWTHGQACRCVCAICGEPRTEATCCRELDRGHWCSAAEWGQAEEEHDEIDRYDWDVDAKELRRGV